MQCLPNFFKKNMKKYYSVSESHDYVPQQHEDEQYTLLSHPSSQGRTPVLTERERSTTPLQVMVLA
jgi:hypothetical protein